MLTPHPTLLIGPSDWDAERMPRQEFAGRIDALWRHSPETERAIVYGSSRHHAEVAYFTNLVPKLGPAVALLSRAGEHRLFVGDAANMLGAARPLTFIENVGSLKELAGALGGNGPRALIIGADYMPVAFRRSVMEAIGKDAPVQDATAQVWSQMRRKSRYELDAIDAAVKATGPVRKAMREALTSGARVTAVVAAGEQAAFAMGAQDVRTLFSLDQGRTLRPFFTLVDQVLDPLMVYLAVRRFNYWAEDFLLLTNRRDPDPVRQRGDTALAAAVKAVRAGTPACDIEAMIAASIRPYHPHPLTARAVAQRMGLALEEPPYTDIGATFEEDEVYSVRVGITDGSRHHIVSRMIRVRDGGNAAFGD